MNKFWMVLGDRTPTIRHRFKHLAEQEAERLARQNPGLYFVVLEAISKSISVSVQTEKLVEEVIPF